MSNMTRNHKQTRAREGLETKKEFPTTKTHEATKGTRTLEEGA